MGYGGIVRSDKHSRTHIQYLLMSKMLYSGCASRGSVAEMCCNVNGPSPAMLAGLGSTVCCSGCCRCSSRVKALGSVLCRDVWCQVHAASWLGSQAWCSAER